MKINYIVCCAIYVVLSAGVTFGLFYTEKYARAENCSQISSSPFGYKTLIPFYSIALYLLEFKNEPIQAIWACAIVFIVSYALESAYRRTLKIGWKNFFKLIACLVVALLILLVTHFLFP